MDLVASTTDSDVTKPASTHSKEAWCKCPRPVGRNLVVCIDGTSNQFGPKVRSAAIFREKVWSGLVDVLMAPIVEHQRYRSL